MKEKFAQVKSFMSDPEVIKRSLIAAGCVAGIAIAGTVVAILQNKDLDEVESAEETEAEVSEVSEE
jgi:hypothetical protein